MLDRMNVCQNQSYSTSKLLISRNLNAWVWRQIILFQWTLPVWCQLRLKRKKNTNRREEHFNPASSSSKKKKSFSEAIYLQMCISCHLWVKSIVKKIFVI